MLARMMLSSGGKVGSVVERDEGGETMGLEGDENVAEKEVDEVGDDEDVVDDLSIMSRFVPILAWPLSAVPSSSSFVILLTCPTFLGVRLCIKSCLCAVTSLATSFFWYCSNLSLRSPG